MATNLQAFCQNKLIIKLKPEFSIAFSEKDSPLKDAISKAGLGTPVRKFPFHIAPKEKTNAWGKPMVDLSLMYELEVPAPLSTVFTLSFIQKQPEFEYAEWEETEAFPLSYPNDPQADSVSGSQRQALKKIKAYQAWNLTDGDTNVVIGILDTGTPVGHEDLSGQIKINPNDPPNGIDDDQNGKIDDYRGWDFGNSDSDPTPDNNGTAPGHGTSVSSLASAQYNNGKGVAGVGGKCKILPLKVWRWNNGFSNFRGYDAIVYAADMGCKVINCSWGSARVNRQYEQDIINYATYNKDALVVAAGGNTAGFFNFLPANYNNVIGVTMTDTTDKIFWAASYHFRLDLSAPGVNVFGIRTDGSYGFVEGGSSMAAPMVSGAAALVRSKYPQLNALQTGELLRVNSDTIYHISGNEGYRGLAGKGRLNIQNALERRIKTSLKAVDFFYRNTLNGAQARIGDTLNLWVIYENYLDSIPGFEARCISLHPSLEVLEGLKNEPPMIPMERKIASFPFKVKILSMANPPEDLRFAIRVKAGTQYVDDQYFSFRAPLPLLDIATTNSQMSVVSNGRLGTLDISNTQGTGIRFNNLPSSGDAGLMVGTGPGKVSNCVFDTSGNDNHFKVENHVGYVPYGNGALQAHAVHHMNDSLAGAARIGIRIKQSSYGISRMGQNNAMFVSYYLENKSGQDLDSLCVGQYNDWDLENPNTNFCFWVDSLKMGVTEGRGFRKRYAAVQVLGEGEPSFYAIDAINSSANGNINLFNGFSVDEKWQTLSKGIGRTTAGNLPSGNNVVQVTGLKMRNLKNGEKRKATFAYLLADSLQTIVTTARWNISQFKSMNRSPSPADTTLRYCQNDTLSTAITGGIRANRIQVFSDSTGSQSIFTGANFPVTIFKDTTFYVAGMDSIFQGRISKIRYQSVQKPDANFSISPNPPGDSLALDSSVIFLAQSSGQGTENQWFVNGIEQDTSGQYSFTIDSLGNYEVCLEQTESLNGCKNRKCKTLKGFLPLSIAGTLDRFKVRIYPNPAADQVNVNGLENGAELQVFNSMGQKVLSEKIWNENYAINTKEFPEGLYVLSISRKRNLISKKLIISRK